MTLRDGYMVYLLLSIPCYAFGIVNLVLGTVVVVRTDLILHSICAFKDIPSQILFLLMWRRGEGSPWFVAVV